MCFSAINGKGRNNFKHKNADKLKTLRIFFNT